MSRNPIYRYRHADPLPPHPQLLSRRRRGLYPAWRRAGELPGPRRGRGYPGSHQCHPQAVDLLGHPALQHPDLRAPRAARQRPDRTHPPELHPRLRRARLLVRPVVLHRAIADQPVLRPPGEEALINPLPPLPHP